MRLGAHFESKTYAAMPIGIVAPLHRIVPVGAETDQTHIVVEPVFKALVAPAQTCILRRDSEKLERIVQFVDAPDLEAPMADVDEAVFRIQEMIKPHRSPPIERAISCRAAAAPMAASIVMRSFSRPSRTILASSLG